MDNAFHTATTESDRHRHQRCGSVFNQYNGAGALLNSLEINNLDQYNGHADTGTLALQYHYP